MENVNPLEISLEWTPNPKTLKLVVNRTLVPHGAYNMRSAEEAESRSPLAARLFQIRGVVGVMVAKDFITVTVDGVEVYEVYEAVKTGIAAFVDSGQPAMNEIPERAQTALQGDAAQIVEVLETHIKPAVAKDGGDIVFENFENGIVYLSLHGSCSGCPSSKLTLKNGVERLLKEKVPSVQEVVAIN